MPSVQSVDAKFPNVVDILLFFKDFVSNTRESVANIQQLLSGNTGLLDNHNRDIFRNAFPYLELKGSPPLTYIKIF